MSGFKLTYSTMFSPPRELHDRFASAADTLAQGFGKHHSLFIDGTDVYKEVILPLFFVVLGAGIRQRFYIDSHASVFRIP